MSLNPDHFYMTMPSGGEIRYREVRDRGVRTLDGCFRGQTPFMRHFYPVPKSLHHRLPEVPRYGSLYVGNGHW